MNRIAQLVFVFFFAIPLAIGFGSQTVKQIDEIKNNTGTDILLNPTDKVDVEYFSGEFALQSTADGELEESAVTNTELGFVLGVTSSIQTQLDSKAIATRLINTTTPLQGGGDLTLDRTLSILQSGIAQDGYLSSVDWNIFNAKSEYIDPTTTDGDLVYYNSGIDRLSVGSNGQVLQVSALGFPEWADLVAVSVTTKGDLQTYSTVPDRLAVGTDSQILSADSAEATGLKWIDLPVSSPITTEGDIAIGDASGDPIRLGIGTNEQILVSNGTTLSYQDIPVSLPDQTGELGNYLKTNGLISSWQNIHEDTRVVKNNLIECPSFEGCNTNAVVTVGSGINISGEGTRTVEASAFNTKRFVVESTSADTLSYKDTYTANFEGQQMVGFCEIKTSKKDTVFRIYSDSNLQASIEVNDNDKWKYYEIPFVGGATDQYYEVYSSDTTTADIIEIDNCSFGKTSPDYIRKIGSAHFVGSLVYANSGCVWNNNSAGYGAYPVDSDCDASSVTGSVQSPDTKIPAIKIPNAVVGTVYRVETQGLLYNNDGASTCQNTLSSTSAYDLQGTSYIEASAARADSSISGDFSFSTSGDKTIQILSKRVNGAGFCTIYGDTNNPFKFSVHAYPDASSTIVTQDTELTAETANEFTVTIGSAANIINQNFNWITSVSNIGTGIAEITTNLDNFAFGNYSCNASSANHGKGVVTAFIGTPSTGKMTVYSYDNLGANFNSSYNITCERITNYNKSATIVGKFENINSSDLAFVVATSTAATVLSTGNIIPFATEEYDTNNNFDGNTFTATASAFYQVNTQVRSSSSGSLIEIYKNGVAKYRVFAGADTDSMTISQLIYLETGEYLNIRAGSNFTVNGSVRYNALTIAQLPDTESIIKNLSNQKTKCQSKVLSANTSTVGVVADLSFSNLKLGRFYSVDSAIMVYATTSTQSIKASRIAFAQSGAEINRMYMLEDAAAYRSTFSSSFKFKSTDTDLNFLLNDSTLTQLIGGATPYTFVTLCELPDTYVETTEF